MSTMDYQYTPIFGDQSLFNNSPKDAEFVQVKSNHFYYKSVDGVLYVYDLFDRWNRCEQDQERAFHAARKITPLPQQTTSKPEGKTGRWLPELGDQCLVKNKINGEWHEVHISG